MRAKYTFTNKLITFTNPKPFITLTLTEKGNLPRTPVPKGARLRIVSESNVSLDKIRKAIEKKEFENFEKNFLYKYNLGDNC